MSEKRRSEVCRYSERRCACGSEHSNANAHVGRCPYPGTAVAGLALEQKHKVKSATAGERDSRAGASTAMQTHKQVGPMPDFSASRLLNENSTLNNSYYLHHQQSDCFMPAAKIFIALTWDQTHSPRLITYMCKHIIPTTPFHLIRLRHLIVYDQQLMVKDPPYTGSGFVYVPKNNLLGLE